jgi:hypothetical protein
MGCEWRVMSGEFIQTLMTSRNSVLLFKQDGQDFFLFILFFLFLLCRSGSSSRRVRECQLPLSNLRSCFARQPCLAGECGSWSLADPSLRCSVSPRSGQGSGQALRVWGGESRRIWQSGGALSRMLCRSASSGRRVRELTLPHSNLRSCSAGQPCPAGGCGRWLSRTAIECELAPSRIF